MASIDKHHGSWRVRWRRNGCADSKSGFGTKAAAQRYARECEDAIAAGHPWPPPPAREAPRWSGIAREWVTWSVGRMRASTLEGKSGMLDDWARWWAKEDIPTTEDIERYAAHLLARGLHPLTARNRGTVVRQVLAWAAGRDAWRGQIIEPARLSLPTALPRTAARALTVAEMDRVILAARAVGRWEEHLLVLMRCTGLRMSQVMHLRWEHVDLEAATLTIPPGLHGSKSQTEWGRGRVVPLQGHLVQELAGWGVREGWLVRRHGGRAGWKGGRAVVDPEVRDVREEVLRPIYAAAGVDVGRQVTHAFRKGWRTALIVAGIDRGLVDYLMGRRQSMDDEVYTDWTLMETPLRKAVESIPEIATGVVTDLSAERRRRGGP